MRRSLALLSALGLSACTRHLYSAPVPVTPSVPPAATPKSTPSATPAITNPSAPNASGMEIVDYVIGRNMMIPVAGTMKNKLFDSFDESRDGERVHRAIDILAARGTPILSADSGRVLRVSTNALGGNTIYATDPLGRVVYYYAHLDAYQPGVVQGLTIARGDTLGFVGTTGNAPKDTPHLHFQVMRMPADGKYWDGDPINPYPLLLLSHDPVSP